MNVRWRAGPEHDARGAARPHGLTGVTTVIAVALPSTLAIAVPLPRPCGRRQPARAGGARIGLKEPRRAEHAALAPSAWPSERAAETCPRARPTQARRRSGSVLHRRSIRVAGPGPRTRSGPTSAPQPLLALGAVVDQCHLQARASVRVDRSMSRTWPPSSRPKAVGPRTRPRCEDAAAGSSPLCGSSASYRWNGRPASGPSGGGAASSALARGHPGRPGPWSAGRRGRSLPSFASLPRTAAKPAPQPGRRRVPISSQISRSTASRRPHR